MHDESPGQARGGGLSAAGRVLGFLLVAAGIYGIVRFPHPVDWRSALQAVTERGVDRYLLAFLPAILFCGILLLRRAIDTPVESPRPKGGGLSTATAVLCALAIARAGLAHGVPPYAIPLALFALPLALGSEIVPGLAAVVISSVLVLGMVGTPPLPWWSLPAGAGAESLVRGTAEVLCAGGIAGFLVLVRARKRSELVTAGAAAGFAMALAYFGWGVTAGAADSRELLRALIALDLGPWKTPGVRALLPGMGIALANGVLTGIVVYHALPLLGLVLRRSMEIDLTQYLSLDHALLVKLRETAPGSYHHSLNVGELAGAAAERIGDDPIFCRAASLFHDIGKMEKPGFFTENIKEEASPHLDLAPRQSARIIIAHVTDGVRIAESYRLPASFNDIIREHHGTTRVEFFYRQARENEREGGPPVEEADFRYPGPRPRTRSSAIIMLADGVEAITRSLKDPTPEALADAVDTILRNKILDNQLARSGLGFRDIGHIREAFLKKLGELHHKRIAYPQKSDTGGFSRKDVEARR